jgi:hypothetical protein
MHAAPIVGAEPFVKLPVENLSIMEVLPTPLSPIMTTFTSFSSLIRIGDRLMWFRFSISVRNDAIELNPISLAKTGSLSDLGRAAAK